MRILPVYIHMDSSAIELWGRPKNVKKGGT